MMKYDLPKELLNLLYECGCEVVDNRAVLCVSYDLTRKLSEEIKILKQKPLWPINPEKDIITLINKTTRKKPKPITLKNRRDVNAGRYIRKCSTHKLDMVRKIIK